MLEAITKTGTDETIFCELTNHSIVLCDAEGFVTAKKIFCYFEFNKDGHHDYDYIFPEGTDVDAVEIVVEKISEKEVLIKIGDDQTVRLFHVKEHSDMIRLRELNYDIEDRWFSNWREVYAFTEYKGRETWADWESFLRGTFMGRFDLGVEQLKHSWLLR